MKRRVGEEGMEQMSGKKKEKKVKEKTKNVYKEPNYE